MPYYYIGIILLAFGGFLISAYIHKKQRTGETLICPIGTTCDTVIHSKYARFLGIPVSLVGMFYYALIVVAYSTFLFRSDLLHPTITFFILGITLTAFLFSLYLTFIQAFALRQWCTWCLISASFCTLIFSFVLLSSEYGFITLLAEHHGIFMGLNILAIALGLGGATISNIMFFKFLKDLRISEFEADVLNTLSQIVWFALALFMITGLGLYLPESAELDQSAGFLVKMIAVAVIILNGAFLNLMIAPNLVKISFGQSHKHEKGELRYIRKLAFALGAISLVSWYSVFVLGLLRTLTAGFLTILLFYLGLLAVAIMVSQFIEHSISKRPVI